MYSEGEIQLAEERCELYDLIQTLRKSFAIRYYNLDFVPDRDSRLVDMEERSWLGEIFHEELAQGTSPTSDKSLAL